MDKPVRNEIFYFLKSLKYSYANDDKALYLTCVLLFLFFVVFFVFFMARILKLFLESLFIGQIVRILIS